MVILSTCPRSSERRLVICPCIVVLLTSFLRSAFSLFNIAWVLTRTVTKALASWDVYRGLAMKQMPFMKVFGQLGVKEMECPVKECSECKMY